MVPGCQSVPMFQPRKHCSWALLYCEFFSPPLHDPPPQVLPLSLDRREQREGRKIEISESNSFLFLFAYSWSLLLLWVLLFPTL